MAGPFFLHDGRTSNLERAIRGHSSNGSEANGVINNFNNLGERTKQDILNFLHRVGRETSDRTELRYLLLPCAGSRARPGTSSGS